VAGSCCTGCWYSSGSGNQCQTTASDSNCGTAGASCKTCAGYENCSATNLSCELDPTSKWQLKIVDATVDKAVTWDSGSSSETPPELYFVADIDGTAVCSVSVNGSLGAEICTGVDTVLDDLLGDWWPNWNYTSSVTYTASQLMSNWCAELRDWDGTLGDECDTFTSNYQVVGRCNNMALTADQIRSGSVILPNPCPNPDTGANDVVDLYLQFTYVP
jgi:hypothetical protein